MKVGKERPLRLLPIALVVSLVAVTGGVLLANSNATGGHTEQSPSVMYAQPAVNGNSSGVVLSCPVPSTWAPSIANLVPLVAQNEKFLNATRGAPYVFDFATLVSNRTETIGGVFEGGPAQNGSVVGGRVIHFPPALEMQWYNYGPNTYCGENAPLSATGHILVFVPLQAGAFNMTGIEVYPLETGSGR